MTKQPVCCKERLIVNWVRRLTAMSCIVTQPCRIFCILDTVISFDCDLKRVCTRMAKHPLRKEAATSTAEDFCSKHLIHSQNNIYYDTKPS